eukprot:9369185-Alexandrium_andersonii.AAC.1
MADRDQEARMVPTTSTLPPSLKDPTLRSHRVLPAHAPAKQANRSMVGSAQGQTTCPPCRAERHDA